MGNSRSRQRTQAASEAPLAADPQQPQQPQQAAPYAQQYPPSQVYRQQGAYYPPQQQQEQPYAANNGQLFGGFHPLGGQYTPGPQPQQQPAAPAPGPSQELTQTATIRNAVNLKKPTLEAAPLPGEPTKLALRFTFDASQPCAVTSYVMATEEASRGCRLSTAAQTPPPAVHYSKGLGLRFPPPAAAAAAAAEGGSPQQQHIIDLSLYSEQQLTSQEKDTYPVVIRLETVTEAGLKQGHSLSELVPGLEQQPWVQSQTTFARLHKEEDGSWALRAIKQKIWVQGVSYELQEIYGLEQSAAAARSEPLTGDENEERLCVICLVNDRDTTVLPCRHMCMCHECAQELRKQTSKCPICRNHVESLLHIKMYRGPGVARPAPEQPLTPAQLAAAQAANAAAEAAERGAAPTTATTPTPFASASAMPIV